MKVAIVEDEQEAGNLLKEFLLRYASEKQLAITIEVFCDGLEILDDYHPDYDVIFLDIEMPHLNGMDTARQIRQTDSNVILIFITNMMQYAIEGYSVQAMDYILKPVKYFDLSFKLDKVVEMRRKSEKSELILKTKGGQRKVAVADIHYLEVIGHCILFHTVSGEIEVWNQPMSAMEQKLKGLSFARCNASYLVNLRYVTEINGMTAQVGPDKLQISRGKRKDFLDALTVYIGRR